MRHVESIDIVTAPQRDELKLRSDTGPDVSAVHLPRENRQTVPPDRALRRAVFWIVLAVIGVAITTAHLLEEYMSYDVGPMLQMQVGSYGNALVHYSKAAPPKKMVVILGNSVYQGHSVVKYMDRFAKEEQRAIQFINLATTGAGISDYVVQAASAIQHKPDMIVICLADCTFLPEGPKFRSDADQQAFEPGILRSVPWSFYPRHFDLITGGGSIVSSVFPLKRLDPILRSRLSRHKRFPKVLSRHIHFPHLNLVADQRIRNRERGQRADLPPMDDYRETMVELMDVLKGGDVPTLFIWQENAPVSRSDEIRTTIAEVIKAYDFAAIVDFSSRWNPEQFGDRNHPVRHHYKAYSHRHYEAICAALDNL
ncbi:MAG: hypothetical protein ABIG44_09820 [Planctomycetota bacterium]